MIQLPYELEEKTLIYLGQCRALGGQQKCWMQKPKEREAEESSGLGPVGIAAPSGLVGCRSSNPRYRWQLLRPIRWCGREGGCGGP